MSIPPMTEPQNFPNPWWIPCKTPWAEERSSGSVLWARNEQAAAQTAAWVMPKKIHSFQFSIQNEFILKIIILDTSFTLNKLKWQHNPRPFNPWDVEETQTIAQQTRGQNFNVPKAADELEAVEVSCHFRQMVDDWGDSKESWTSAVILKDIIFSLCSRNSQWGKSW